MSEHRETPVDNVDASSRLAALSGSMFGEASEEYYCKRDDFIRYISREVNPARIAAGLEPLDMRTAEECFRILNDFARKLIQSNAQDDPRRPGQ